MNPDVVRAVDELAAKGVLPAPAVPRLRAVASGELISIRRELEALLYVGVMLVVAGVGFLVQRHFDRIGPLTVAIALGAAAAGCLVWCWRRGRPSDLAFEYVLLLGALLAAADLAFVEVKFTPLGAHWAWHFLIVTVFYLALAIRFDSNSLFGLALTAFAAWRGVRLWFVTSWAVPSERIVLEALACGAGFLVVGKLLERVRWRPHFEPVASWLGAMLFLCALATRMTYPPGRSLVAALLVASGAFLAWFALDERRMERFALGVVAAGCGACGLAWRAIDSLDAPEELQLLVVAIVAAAVIAGVLRVHRTLKASS